jgi:hypothetical protein
MPDFSWYNIPNDHKNTNLTQKYQIATKIPNGYKKYQMAYKIYPNWGFWFENIPSGNPAQNIPNGSLQYCKWP